MKTIAQCEISLINLEPEFPKCVTQRPIWNLIVIQIEGVVHWIRACGAVALVCAGFAAILLVRTHCQFLHKRCSFISHGPFIVESCNSCRVDDKFARANKMSAKQAHPWGANWFIFDESLPVCTITFHMDFSLGYARFAEMFTFSTWTCTNCWSTQQELHDYAMKGQCEMNEHLLWKIWQCGSANKMSAKCYCEVHRSCHKRNQNEHTPGVNIEMLWKQQIRHTWVGQIKQKWALPCNMHGSVSVYLDGVCARFAEKNFVARAHHQFLHKRCLFCVLAGTLKFSLSIWLISSLLLFLLLFWPHHIV